MKNTIKYNVNTIRIMAQTDASFLADKLQDIARTLNEAGSDMSSSQLNHLLMQLGRVRDRVDTLSQALYGAYTLISTLEQSHD